MGIFDDLTSVPAIALDYRFAGLVRLCGLGVPAKWIETRGTKTHYRGPVAIYATYGEATKKDPFLRQWFEATRRRLVPQFIDHETFEDEVMTFEHRGCVVALATLSEVVNHEEWRASKGACVGRRYGEKRDNPWGWRLTNIWPVHPFKAAAAPGFFRVSANDVKFRLGYWFSEQHRNVVTAHNPTATRIVTAMHMLHDGDLPGLGARWGKP